MASQPDCLVCRIVAGEVPATVVLETDQIMAFRDINPQAPTHVLVVPKDHHATVAELATADPAVAAAVLQAAGAIADAEGVAERGYRIVFNTGAGAGQSLFHAHAHVLGGRGLSWPPG